MRICLAQTAPKLGDVKGNLDAIEETLESARPESPSLVIFPELALTGYRLRDLVPHVAVRLDRPGWVLDRLRTFSQRQAFLVGLVEEAPDHRFYNSAVQLEDGAIRHIHRKCYLPTYGMFDEAMDFAPGERLAAYDACGSRIGLLICEDAWHPAAATVMAQDGATVLIITSATPLRGIGAGSELLSLDTWKQLVTTLAMFNTTAAVWVNRCGFEDGLAFAGGSFAVGPTGRLIAEAPSLEKTLLFVDLDPYDVRAARAAFPLVRDERPHLIARELNRFPPPLEADGASESEGVERKQDTHETGSRDAAR